MIRYVIQCMRYSGDWVTLLKLCIPKMMSCENCRVWRLDWNKCPADIFILLNECHLKSNRESDWMYVPCNFTTRKTKDGTLLAIQDDVTQTYVISNQPRSENLKDHHWDRTRMQFAQSQGMYKLIAQLLNTKNIIMPFVMDPFGQ